MKKTAFGRTALIILELALAAILCMPLAGCGQIVHRVMDHYGPKGLSAEKQAEVDAVVADYTERIVGPTWHSIQWDSALRFYEDGTVEIEGRLTEPDNWRIEFGPEYSGDLPVSEMSQDAIRDRCDYFLRYEQPIYGGTENRHYRISFSEDGNLMLWDDEYASGPDYVHEIPAAAVLDPYFLGNYPANGWGVWGDEDEDGSIGVLWIFQPDGLGAETIGSMNGELIYPDTFLWGVRDDVLYIEWNRSEEYIEEYGRDIDVCEVERGDGEFWVTDPFDSNGGRRHFVATDALDIYSW